MKWRKYQICRYVTLFQLVIKLNQALLLYYQYENSRSNMARGVQREILIAKQPIVIGVGKKRVGEFAGKEIFHVFSVFSSDGMSFRV